MAKRFQKYQVETLELAFDKSDNLTKETKMELARDTGLDMEQITSWFYRKRARKRKMESLERLERINSELRRCVEESMHKGDQLRQELQERIDKEGELQQENLRLKRRLAIVEADLQTCRWISKF